MAGKKPDEVLTIGVELESRRALQAMKRLEQEMKGELKNVSKAVSSFGRLNQDVLKDLVHNTKEYIGELDDLELAQTRQVKQLDKIADQIEALQKKQEKASESAKKDIEEQIDLLKKQSNTMSTRVAMKIVSTASTNKMRKDMTEMFGKVADDAGSIFSSFLNKDLKGSFEAFAKGGGKALGFGLQKAASAALRGGGRLKDAGAGLAERGAAKGGMGGSAMSGVGKALQGVGGMFAKLGPMLNTVAKLGPLIGIAASALMAVVKLFIDAEAQAKQFQKDILQSASTAEYLAAAGGDATLAFGGLESTMKDIRNAAYDLENLEWGINADDHKQVINVLTQEGVSLMRLEQEAQAAGKTMYKFAADLTHTSVAYSRAFGVPLQEINQMQAEMMNDLGMSLETTRLQFAQMTRSAAESGIAANKFFSIIRGVSADLSLYNSRLEDAVKTLKALGKVMNPREAQKFMQTAMQGLKNMGRQERLRMTLLAGTGKMSKLVERDIKNKQESIAKQIGETGKFSAEEASKILKSGNKAAINDMVNKLPTEMQGAIREGVIDMGLQKARGGKGVFGVSGASANLGPAGALEAYRSALKGWGGGNSLQEGAGTIGMEMMAENLGISQEQLDQMIKFEAAMDMERETLKSIFQKQASGQALTADEQARLQKAQEQGIKSGNDVATAGYDQIYGTMDEASKKAHEDAGKVENFAKKQADLTSSLLDKLSVLVDFIMNQVYNVFLEIWDLITKIPGIGGSDEERVIKRQALLSKDKGIQEAVQKATDAKGQLDIYAFRANMIGEQGGIGSSVGSAFGHLNEARKGGEHEYEEAIKPVAAMVKMLNDEMDVTRGSQALSAANIDSGKASAVTAAMSGGADLETAMKTAGLSGEEMMAVWQKSVWFLDPMQIAMWGNTLKKTGDMTGQFRAQGSKIDDLTMQLYDKYELGDQAREIDEKRKSYGGQTIATSGFHKTEEGQKLLASTSESTDKTAKSVENTEKALTQPHTAYFKFSNSFLRGDYKRTMEEIMLDSIRQGLFEYFMYSQMDPAEVAKFMGEEGMTAKEFSERVGKEAEEGRTPKDFTGLDYVEADKNAAGGLVTSVNGGLAMVRAAAGEGLASIGPGERILPAGGGRGGDQFNISVNGIGGNDLARFLHVKVADGIAEYKRRQRFV